MQVSSFFPLSILWLLGVVATRSRDATAELIPDSFSSTDINQYTVRYVSSGGRDSEACLQGQPYPPPASSCQQEPPQPVVQHCRTIGYSLLGECANSRLPPGECIPTLRNNLVVLVYPGTYDFGDYLGVQIFHFTNLIIKRVPECREKVIFQCLEFTESKFNNLFLVNVTNLAIDGIEFSHCGPKSPGAAMNATANTIITNCEFKGNLNSGFVVYISYDTFFYNCTFRDNNSTLAYNVTETLNPGSFRYAGGLTFLWRGLQEGPVTVLIHNCTFINNTASINDKNRDDSKERPNFYVPRGHGGAIVASFNRTNNITLTIEDSFILNNEAIFIGGGIFISFFNSSLRNQIVINRTVIEGNSCNTTGGGISMNIFEVANSNHLVVENTNFTNNRALLGGGACTINLQDNRIQQSENGDPDNVLLDNVGVFKNCRFQENYSPTGGSAVSLVSNARVDQVSNTTNFTNCEFQNNQADIDGDSALMSFRFPVSMRGSNIFKGNKGGGIALLQAEFHNHGNTVLEDNYHDEFGGGMALRDSSVIILFEEANMTFVNNSAARGGGLAVRSPFVEIDNDIIPLFNTRCFMQYEIERTEAPFPPSEWKASLNFINNSAQLDGGAIYSTDLERCTYTPSINLNSRQANSYTRSIFSLDKIFNFRGNTAARPLREVQDVASAPSRMLVKPQAFKGAPGELISLTISAVDDSDNWQDAIWTILDGEAATDSEFSSLRAGEQQYTYKICGQSEVDCSPNDEESKTLRFSLIDVNNMTEVNVTVRNCYPGYYLAEKECAINRTSPILRPDRDNHYLYIKPEFYAEYNETEPDAIAYAIIPIPFQKCNRKENNLTGCLFKYDDPSHQCADGREGFLCGSCPSINGTQQGVDLTLIQCRECSVRDTILVVFIVMLFIVGCALIMIFNIGIPNEMRGCLFFVQVVGFVYQYRVAGSGSSWDLHFSQVFGSGLYLPLCPLPAAKALIVTSYGLVLPIMAIITIFAYIISARFIKLLSNKNSFDGIWFLTFIIYKFVADTCFNVLRCQKVLSNGESTIHGNYVFYYDGRHKCFTLDDLEYLSFAVVAVVLGVMVILFPALILLISFKRFEITQHITDVLNKDLKVSCRWWSSFDLFRRLLFIVVVLAFNYLQPIYSQLALLFSGLFVFLVFACSQPYNSKLANLIETLVLLDLLLLSSISLDNGRQNQDAVRPYSYILLLIPFVSLVLYVLARLYYYAWKKWCPLSVRDIYYKYKRRMWSKLSWIRGHHSTSRPERVPSKDESELTSSTLEYLDSEYVEFREELLDD